MPYADPERAREYQHQYYVENREKKREYRRQYNREKHRKSVLKWRLAHPEKNSEYLRRQRAKLRTQVLDLLGGKCARCGIDDPIVLQLDHINGGGTAERKSLGSYGAYRKALKDPSTYQLLCANCNMRKRVENEEYKKRRKEEIQNERVR